ncbi:replication-associated recombination protein A [Candidatus Daviesbacteria bacterium]|nr:replication-associated recombination protein A [Candidatus Daviesbacteria bacterium]
MNNSPLADRIRPKSLDQLVGQRHILSPDKLLYKAIKSGNIFSMIFWGPPGVGKTTLARIIANELKTEFYEYSAVTTGIVELKKLFESLKNSILLNPPVVFIDEIHRFNKAQQDAFLPYVENGTIILIGATTENPSFEVIGPLLSRTRVFVLNQLSNKELEEIINKALKDKRSFPSLSSERKESGLGKLKIKLNKDAKDFLIEGSNGDSRILLNALEVAVNSVILRARAPFREEGSQNLDSSGPLDHQNDKVVVIKELIEEALQKRSLLYDKAGDEHYNTISAFIKSMRASQVDSALYYLARMVNAGEDPLFIARRMVIFASEDIGQAAPTALVVANEVFRAVETIGYPECQINLAAGVVYLCSAKKDRSSYDAYFKALEDVQKFGNLEIPLNIRNAPTKLMKDLGYGKGYEKYSKEDLLPEKLKGKKYYASKKE